MEERLQQLERRLVRTQRQARFLSALALAAVAGSAAGLLRPDPVAAQPAADPPPRTVLKAPFDVVGTDGKRLMTVEEKREGGAVVRFYRPGNRASVIIDQTGAGASVGLVGPDDKLGTVLDSLHDGGGLSVYSGTPSREVVLLRSSPQAGGTHLRLADPTGKVLYSRP
jgi:hypothetical protein